jgi:hypothetical protein
VSPSSPVTMLARASINAGRHWWLVDQVDHLSPRRFPSGADAAARVLATAVVKLAQIRSERRL